MINVTFVTVGNLKEAYLKQALSEYEKRLKGFCNFKITELKETKLQENPSFKEISRGLSEEGEKILASIPQKAYKIAMCVEGKELSSLELADKIETAALGHSDICFVIGSSYGLSDSVKDSCDLRLSVSKLTFPHQLMRVILAETVYRAFTIIKGTKYHK